MTGDTIFAPSTAPGRAGLAVVRLSGPQTAAALTALTGASLPPPRRAVLRRIVEPGSGQPIDRGLVLWFPAPASFTGEDVGELHLHGGRAVVAAALEALGRLPGLRPAEAGEFTRRAFDNDRLDLSAVEGLADLIAAETEAQRRQALRQMEGGLGRLAAGWLGRLTRALAHFEAAIDFVEEELPEALGREALGEAAAVAAEIVAQLDDRHRGERLRDGFSAVILGLPNAGKSSLLNALARRDVAIVSEAAGTTRDIVEVHLDLGGYPVILADTAGLRDLPGPVGSQGEAPGEFPGGDQAAIERAGMARARDRAAGADVKLLLVDLAVALRGAAGPAAAETAVREAVGEAVQAAAGKAAPDRADSRTLLLLNKADACDPAAVAAVVAGLEDHRPLAISAATGAGLDRLLARLVALAGETFGGGEEAASITRLRHRRALEEAVAALAAAQNAALPELVAEELRLAVRALGRIGGRVDVEDLLDIVFSDFCIGK